ncbi:NAD(P)H-dependent glycerol-3-phosphate dehydrogenase [Xylophilus sp. GOD-11R]|uniref:NAD(P)H-dependent glycerol-3-phosphate dehydrogenase n=1 Tax=Xylophilus sp. GOD-11R TaxID=3089814 RepID=UPI00298D448A|nr:NAD(P)H-dependent glycerol-3-phosphate dehydrogenase [Xylophilus sp. GOD-11R]WPB56570.1 NAD(P)H-dependent glycerol-3-phosphate dehydrogenase [Xylophilus sp. GOD-11R]
MKIAVLGAGAWGTALAIAASRNRHHDVALWSRSPAQAAAMQASRQNARYLADIPLPESLAVVSGDVASVASTCDLVVIATPMAGLRSMLTSVRPLRRPVAWLCKGFEAPQALPVRGPADDGLLAHEVCAAVAPELRAAVLSGPSFAQEVAREQPTALVAGSADAELREALVSAFHGRSLRVYANDDIVGIEVGGAVKNVLAIATGLCDGLGLGLNARAALVTRGLVEMARLGVALGGRVETFHGLSGLGDLVLTATGNLSRNRKVGLLLAQGLDEQQAVASLGHVAEGVYCARSVVRRARALGVEMPIAEAVVALLDGRLRPAEAVAALMERGPVFESR